MASARRGMHKLAVRHLEARQNCDVPTSCLEQLEAFGEAFDSNDTDVASAALDVVCSDRCVGPLDDFFECSLRYQRYAQFVCEQQDGQYCFVTIVDFSNACGGDCPDDDTCPDACSRCVRPYVNDLSCCANQYRSYSFYNISEMDLEDPCGNRYDTCSGGAIAVPTVLTALLLMVMAAIVM